MYLDRISIHGLALLSCLLAIVLLAVVPAGSEAFAQSVYLTITSGTTSDTASFTITGITNKGGIVSINNDANTQLDAKYAQRIWSFPVTLVPGPNTFHVIQNSVGFGNVVVSTTITYNAPAQPEPEPDTTSPSITLLGSNTVEVEHGSTYTDAGATCTDNTDGDITVTPDTTAVVTLILGTYEVTFDCSDAAGNSATQVTRSVQVVATAQTPVITSSGTVSDASFLLEGTGPPSAKINILKITNNGLGESLGILSTDSSGDWQLQVTLDSGDNVFEIRTVSNVRSEQVTITYDSAQPEPEPVVQPLITSADVTVNTPTFNLVGTGPAGVPLVIRDTGGNRYDVTPDAQGDWNVDVTLNIVGTNPFTVNTVQDPTGIYDESPSVTITYDDTINTPPPGTGDGGSGDGGSGDGENNGGGGSDWKKKPTFGLSHEISTSQLVEDGFSFNGRTIDITDNWHTDFTLTSSIIGESNTVTMKTYAPDGLKYVELSLGVPEIGEKSNAEANIQVNLDRNYENPNDYDVTEIIHEQSEPLINESNTRASIAPVLCNSTHIRADCYSITINFTVDAPLSYDVVAITAVDTKRRSMVTYVNEGVQFTGESLLPAATASVYSKNTNQGAAYIIQLTQEDRRYNIWTDSEGYLWTQNDFGTWLQITHPDSVARSDESTSVMTRAHSSFATLVQYEQDKAALVFDSEMIQQEIGDTFAYDFPDNLPRSTDPTVLERLGVEEMLALEKSLNQYIYDDSWSDFD